MTRVKKMASKTGNNWKIFNTSPEQWDKMLTYYEWSAAIFCLVFAVVLFMSKIWLIGVSMLILFWYYIPLKAIRAYDDNLPFKKKYIFYIAVFLIAVGIKICISEM